MPLYFTLIIVSFKSALDNFVAEMNQFFIEGLSETNFAPLLDDVNGLYYSVQEFVLKERLDDDHCPCDGVAVHWHLAHYGVLHFEDFARGGE